MIKPPPGRQTDENRFSSPGPHSHSFFQNNQPHLEPFLYMSAFMTRLSFWKEQQSPSLNELIHLAAILWSAVMLLALWQMMGILA
jgi:hypothetical protein